MVHSIDLFCNHSNSIDFKINFADIQKNVSRFDEDVLDASFVIVWETAVSPLSKRERILFFVLTTIICTVAYLGNVLVLYVNFTRKQRLLFRTCLISLAISDIMYVQVTSIVYLPRLFITQSALWVLGSLACAVLPFLQTLAILVNSILLVCIAMDRYMAVVRIAKSQWEPGKLFCLTCCVLIWGMAAGISSPMIAIYQFYKLYVVPLPKYENEELTYYVGTICASNKDQNAYFFSIIFSFIFAPLVITFIWMNAVVARAIWIRRHTKASTSSIPTNSMPSMPSSNANSQSSPTLNEMSTGCSERKQRQERLFRVILLLMSVFFICRLPTWMYLIYQLNTTSNDHNYWHLYFGFGNLALLNCALNPYLYSFMSETIKVFSFLGNIIRSLFYSVCNFFHIKQ
ncbi:orexin receptor type 2-like [Chironomus tepperi]|uniref:orexin receptor type 2-like n=1 Tax=Chironomus tepperi TaxID=113505 RepID=UPI00391FC9A4